MAEYQEVLQSKMAHAGYLTPEQQVQLFTGGLPDPIRTYVELQASADLQHAMLFAQAYECRSATNQHHIAKQASMIATTFFPTNSIKFTNPGDNLSDGHS